MRYRPTLKVFLILIILLLLFFGFIVHQMRSSVAFAYAQDYARQDMSVRARLDSVVHFGWLPLGSIGAQQAHFRYTAYGSNGQQLRLNIEISQDAYGWQTDTFYVE